MKFKNVIVLLAIYSLSAPILAQEDGGRLRRTVAENDTVTTEVETSSTKQDVIILNQNTVSSQQPATVVEAQPVSESKAEQLRKARQGAEVQTEQKIVEKLEESRLREEQERADRLFGNKFETPKAEVKAEATEVAPKATDTVVVPEQKPAQVTIEKVEIVQPAATLPPPTITSVKDLDGEEASVPAAKSSLKSEDLAEQKPIKERQFYVSGMLGGVNYDASNVKGNFGGGFAIGLILNERTAVEGSFLYSNHYIDTFWNPGIYREMDQYDVALNAKYFILDTRIKPYVGAGAAYITREYKQRILTSNGFTTSVVDGPSEDQTQAINLNLLAGADFAASENLRFGLGLEYSTNVMNQTEFNFNNYGLPENVKAIEEIDYYTVKASATLTF